MRRRVAKTKRCRTGKVSYRDEESALYVARSTNWQGSQVTPTRAYLCEFCHHWHLTSQPLKETP